ncbi:helix-turn-helix domain-containing protein [Chryseobacterium jejuense]|uniref:helix-turn-helix domain-containing protein n=1 Tax=Chryseobacterium jejuense TaxID=445960 RepID=UPI001AE255B6|nr:helix-turn-helix domain-containing protein [Chryseobacterium jejuense]MBP2619501.1 hypothetical protein [Chryseobacterium jejuense]
MKNTPDYKKNYNDMLIIKYPERKEGFQQLLSKSDFSALDIIEINKVLFSRGFEESARFNQRHRSYDLSTIIHILEYQKKNKLNNSQLAKHFKLSRNTVTKWKSHF